MKRGICMSNKELAEILFPNTLNLEDILKKYPKRDKFITRYAPSPTGFTHLGNLYTALLKILIKKEKLKMVSKILLLI